MALYGIFTQSSQFLNTLAGEKSYIIIVIALGWIRDGSHHFIILFQGDLFL
jgi:hypothetical protein